MCRIFHSGFSEAAAIPGAPQSHTGKVASSGQKAPGKCWLTLLCNLFEPDYQ